MLRHEYLNYFEIWDAVQTAFFNLNAEEASFLSNIVVKATHIGGSYLLIQVETLEGKYVNASRRDVETICVSGQLNKVMKKVAELAAEEDIHTWKESKGGASVWCFKILWDEDEDE